MLWKKETDQKNAMYINLFGSPTNSSESNDKKIKVIFEFYECFSGIANARNGPFKKNTLKANEFRQFGNNCFHATHTGDAWRWLHAIDWYNRSLCYAENGSEMMALAYANRSSCFFHLKMYQKCLTDIELAKQNNYPHDKIDKLERRKTLCRRMMETELDQSEAFQPKLDFEPSENFPCFANVLKIENNHEHGRHIVATEDIEVGKTIMVDQNYFFDAIKKYKRCNICYAIDDNFKPCKKCSFTMFCPRCEKNDLHHIECEINPTYFGALGIISQRMVVVRSILLAMNTFSDIDELITAVERMVETNVVEAPDSLFGDPQSNYRAFFKIHPNPKQHTDVKLASKIYFIYHLLMGQRDVAAFFHSEVHKRFLQHLIGHHLIVIKYSIQRVTCETGREDILTGNKQEIDYEWRMSIPASYFNHSCAPNAYILSQKGYTVCLVVRPIRKNEQICVTYDASLLSQEKTKRQQILQTKFNFQCKCQRCQSPQLESSSLKSNDYIARDLDFQYFCNEIKNATINLDLHLVDSLRSKSFEMLKKYGKASWCRQINDIMDYLNDLLTTEKTGLLKVTLMVEYMRNDEFLEV